MSGSYKDLLQIVSDALDRLDELGVPPATGGLALAVAGLRELSEEPDARSALEAYHECLKLIMVGLTRYDGPAAIRH